MESKLNNRLLEAVTFENLQEVEKTLKEGALVSVYENWPIKIAAHTGNLSILKLLIDNGADPKANQSESLRVAAEHGHLEAVKYLISRGAEVDAKYDSALKRAKRGKHTEVYNFLKLCKRTDSLSKMLVRKVLENVNKGE